MEVILVMACKKRLSGFLVIIILLGCLGGCILSVSTFQFALEEYKKYSYKDFIDNPDLDRIRLNGVTVNPVIRDDYYGYCDVMVSVKSKEKYSEIILMDAVLKTEKGKILFEQHDLDKIILAENAISVEYGPGYSGLEDIGRFPRIYVRDGMKLFATLTVEDKTGERKTIDYVFDVDLTWGPISIV